MKIRNSFVSNSSSSSFVICAPKEKLDEILNSYDKNHKKFFKTVISGYGDKSKKILNGKEYIVYCGTYDSESFFSDFEDCCPEEEDDPEYERGCTHNFDREKNKYCAKCGAAAYVEVSNYDENQEEDSEEVWYDFIKKIDKTEDCFAVCPEY